MGCGKSTIGKAFAKTANLPLFDTDTAVEQLHGQTIAEIFATEGEQKFREYEHEVIVELLNNPEPSIIVCGGGTPCFHNTMPLLNQRATTVYLQAPVELLYQRLHPKAALRPMLQNKPDLKQYITTLLAQREPVYSQAHRTIAVADKTIDDIVQLLTDNCL